MRNPNRIPSIGGEIVEVWQKYPDMRLGQLLVIATSGEDLFSLEDRQVRDRLRKFDAKQQEIAKMASQNAEDLRPTPEREEGDPQAAVDAWAAWMYESGVLTEEEADFYRKNDQKG